MNLTLNGFGLFVKPILGSIERCPFSGAFLTKMSTKSNFWRNTIQKRYQTVYLISNLLKIVAKNR